MRYAAKSNAQASYAAAAPAARRAAPGRSLSNQARLRQLGLGPELQAKLRVGAANDALEREADRAADQVMGIGATTPALAAAGPALSRKCAACEAAPAIDEDAAPLVSRSVAGGGRALDGGTRAFMESRFGRDFSGVRVHTGGAAEAGAAALGARAFTVGRDVVFGAGDYDTGSEAGRHLLAHELAHTVQQGAAGGPAMVSRAIAPELSEGQDTAIQKVGCGDYKYKTCGGQACVHPTGTAGYCRWSGTVAIGCICRIVESTVVDAIKRMIVPALIAIGVVVAVEAVIATVACFASGACELAALVALLGFAGAMLVAGLVHSLGIGGDGAAAANDPAAPAADPGAAPGAAPNAAPAAMPA